MLGERKLRLKKTPTVGDAIALYGFICPILKMLPYDVYLRVEIERMGLILESDRHYFDDSYILSVKSGAVVVEDLGADYLSSLDGSRSYPIDSGSHLKSRRQLEEAGFLRKRAVNGFMSRYSKPSLIKNAFDSDIKWERAGDGGALLVMTSSSEGDYRRLEKRLLQQFELDYTAA